jgi:hypothetical protein
MNPPAFMYHEVIPENSKDAYVAHDTVDFNCTFEGRACNLGSFRIEGVLEVLENGQPLYVDANKEKRIFYNPAVGAHACFESVMTTMNGQVVENISTSYPRYVCMTTKATSEQGDIGNDSNNTCELKASYLQATQSILQGSVPKNQPTNAVNLPPDFSIRPLVALNSSNRALPYAKSGMIRVSVNMARLNSLLWGADVGANTTYSVKELRVTFTSVPEEMATADPIMLRTKLGMKQSIQSNLANVALRVPAVCTAVSCSFLPQAQENSPTYDTNELTTVPNLKSVQYAFNDITSQLVTFKLKSDPEFIKGYIDSFMDTGLNTLTPNDWSANNGYGVGVPFGMAVDLRNQRFSVQLNSDVSNVDPMVIYLFFHSFLQV